MQIEDVHCGRELHFGLMEFFSANGPTKTEKAVVMGWGGEFNPCSKLVIETAEGTLSAGDEILYALQDIDLFGNGGRIVFHPIRCRFQTKAPEAPTYWALPLFNFISEFRPYCQSRLGEHPLRVPHPENDEDSKESTSGCIVFAFNNRPGFIEPLPDYDQRALSLSSGRQKTAITAVMVGELANTSLEFPQLLDSFPASFISLLGVCTGIEVGAPWIECRTSQGRLTDRVHVKLGQPLFSEGFRPIREIIHGGTGRFLTNAQSAPGYKNTFLQSAINYLVLGGLHVFTLEDRFTYLCRALESLCTEYGCNRQVLLHRLDSVNQKVVTDALNEAAGVIHDAATQTNDAGQREALLKIESRTKSNPANIDMDFGLAVVSLLQELGFADADVLDAHYRSNPRTDGRTWPQVLSHYRGTATHRGHFEFGSEHEIDDVFRYVRHLHDILVRIVLKRLAYDGSYQPTVSILTTDRTVDWVKASTPAKLLGY
jgi:hypothetical protein